MNSDELLIAMWRSKQLLLLEGSPDKLQMLAIRNVIDRAMEYLDDQSSPRK